MNTRRRERLDHQREANLDRWPELQGEARCAARNATLAVINLHRPHITGPPRPYLRGSDVIVLPVRGSATVDFATKMGWLVTNAEGLLDLPTPPTP